jgi:hypothetical protein
MFTVRIPDDICPAHAKIARAWRDNHYNAHKPTEWPGGSHIMDSRTTHAERGAKWDRKNLDAVEQTFRICRSGRSPQCTSKS